jgi:hypothetical protein
MENIMRAGPNTIKAHLRHLRDHGQTDYLEQAVAILMKKGLPIPNVDEDSCASGGCPGSAARSLQPGTPPVHPGQQKGSYTVGPQSSQLKQWPVQLHLINPNAPYLQNADLLISADCVPFAFADFHNRFVKDKIVITLCPKLDQGIESYIEKLGIIFKTKKINSITVVRMEVPCCGGIEMIVQKAMEKAGVMKMVKLNIVSIDGKIV